MTGMPTYTEVMREVYGTAEDAERQRYGLPARRKRKPKPRPVTAHARILHECGHYVYTERHGKRPAAFPPTCWYCGASTTFSPTVDGTL